MDLPGNPVESCLGGAIADLHGRRASSEPRTGRLRVASADEPAKRAREAVGGGKPGPEPHQGRLNAGLGLALSRPYGALGTGGPESTASASALRRMPLPRLLSIAAQRLRIQAQQIRYCTLASETP